MPLRGCLTPPLLVRIPSALEPHLFRTNLEYWLQGHPLGYRRLPPLDISPKSLCPCRLEHPLLTLLFSKYRSPVFEPAPPPPAARNPHVYLQDFASLQSKPRFTPQRGPPPGPPFGRNFLRQSGPLPPSLETSLNVHKIFSPSRCSSEPPSSPCLTGVGHAPNN